MPTRIDDAPASLALWLRAGRVQRGMSLDDVAKVTKIQARILERLEAGRLDGLPAEVFVRGFIRSVARCVGLDEREALQRYAACGATALSSAEMIPTVRSLGPSTRALVEAMADLAPGSATSARATPRKMLAVEVTEASETADAAKGASAAAAGDL
ncbi:MAG: helix-turn-helix domain-containing protein, partial [bacterium]